MIQVQIRTATLNDLETIVRFNQNLAFESEDISLNIDVLARGVRRALTHPDLCSYFVAEIAGQVVGQTMITSEVTDWRDGLIWWIQSVYVDQQHRRQGVFKHLYAHICKLAKARKDVRCIRLYVEEDNHHAQKTYESLGMEFTNYRVMEATI
jgi:ribosomal protein S18 acetylase RimI-like enzyme